MTMKVNESRGAQQNGKANAGKSADYEKQQEALAKKIKFPHSLRDLKYNAQIKEEQIKLAKANGDMTTARILQEELNQINKDVEAKETSVFDKAKEDKKF